MTSGTRLTHRPFKERQKLENADKEMKINVLSVFLFLNVIILIGCSGFIKQGLALINYCG